MTGYDEQRAAHPLSWVRQRQGWSLADVARVVARRSGVNMAAWRQKVYRWEHGVTPERAAQHALADALGIDRAHVDALGWPAWLLLVDPAEPIDAAWTPAQARATLAQVVGSAAMDRRGFLAFSGSTVAAVAATWARTPPEPVAAGVGGAQVGTETVECLKTRLSELWRLDDTLGGGHCLPAAHADLCLVVTLLNRARYSDQAGRALFSAAASLGRFAGWAAFDAGHASAAQRYWHAALRAAHAANDRDQAVYVLSNLALQAVYAGDGATAIDVLDTARARVDPSQQTVLAMLDCWAARGHAQLGEHAEAERRLGRADELWSQRSPGDDPDWVYWMPQPSTTAEAGAAMLALGDTARAEAMLTEGLAELDDTSARETNLYLVRIAEARLAAGRLDEAVATARSAIDSAAGIDSARVDARVDALLGQLPAGEPAVAELRDYRAERQRSTCGTKPNPPV